MESLSKSDIRARVRAALRALSENERRTQSHLICGAIRTLPFWKAARNVLLFAPFKDEPDITQIIDEALCEKMIVTAPRFDPARGSYVAARLTARAALDPGPFGALEPGAGSPSFPLNQLDLVLVPGIAYDLAGRRLGRGKGFYDRLLAEVRGHKCGVAFDMQIVSELPEEPHDVRVDSILTPTRWLSACAD